MKRGIDHRLHKNPEYYDRKSSYRVKSLRFLGTVDFPLFIYASIRILKECQRTVINSDSLYVAASLVWGPLALRLPV